MHKVSIASLIGGLVVVGGLVSAPTVVAEEVEKTVEQLCQEYAKEDGVDADKLDVYIAECIASMNPETSEEDEKPE